MTWLARLTIVISSAILLQVGVFSQLPVLGVRPLVPLLMAVVGGLALGPERGAAVGFAAGLAFDLLLTTPLGLCSLVFTVVGFVVGRYRTAAPASPWWRTPAITVAGSAAGVLALATTGLLLGQPNMLPEHVLTSVVVVSGVNGMLAPLGVHLLRWALAPPERVIILGSTNGR